MKLIFVLVLICVLMDVSIARLKARDPRCGLPRVTGPCRALIPKFAFDCSVNKCVGFNYGGCGGNGNRFDTKAACERTCPPCSTRVE